MEVVWAGANHTTRELRNSQQQVLGVGTSYGRTHRKGVPLVATFCNAEAPVQTRTNEAGAILNVEVVWRGDSSNTLDRSVEDDGHVYRTRDGVVRPTLPNIQEYFTAAKHSGKLGRDAEIAQHRNMIAASLARMVSAVENATQAGFPRLAQGNLVRWLWRYPIMQSPIILNGMAMTTPYYNWATIDVAFGFPTRLFGGFQFTLVIIIQQSGGSEGPIREKSHRAIHRRVTEIRFMFAGLHSGAWRIQKYAQLAQYGRGRSTGRIYRRRSGDHAVSTSIVGRSGDCIHRR